MRKTVLYALAAAVCGILVLASQILAQQNHRQSIADTPASFTWPEGKRAAVSLSFDDARPSQVDTGLPLLKKQGVRVTFFVTSSNLEKRLGGWKQAVADGHEIGNHSMSHPCTGNYAFSSNNALEDYSLEKMAHELDGANEEIQKLLGVKPVTFAYPCGQKFVGRSLDERSYVPLVAGRFIVGRGYLDEAANNPAICDLSRAMGTVFDDSDFSYMKQQVDDAAKEGRWVIFVGHDIGEKHFQTTDVHALESLCEYLKDSGNGIWLGTVEEIGSYIKNKRAAKN